MSMFDGKKTHSDKISCSIIQLFEERGGSRYGGESVTQLEHALQAAHFAERAGASSEVIAAALLHDVGHLLHTEPDDAPMRGFDDSHEKLGADWLAQYFGPGVVELVLLHVAAKRFLCATDPEYLTLLSPPSALSLELQGGPFTSEEVATFELNPFHRDAVAVRRWDDSAKVPNLQTPPLEHFLSYVERSTTK